MFRQVTVVNHLKLEWVFRDKILKRLQTKYTDRTDRNYQPVYYLI